MVERTGSLAGTNLPAALSSATYDAANRLTQRGTVPFSYDANGNLTNDGTNAYTWDARNHLTAISSGSTASFVYDGFGRRMKKTIGGITSQFLYDGLNPVQELNSSNVATANLLTGLNIDEFFSRTDSSGARSFLTDILGSTLALTDASGTIQTQYTYEPFGNVTVSGATNGNSYQFTGRENDGTGLYFYRARYYSPTFQRFIAQDPLLDLLPRMRLPVSPFAIPDPRLLNGYAYVRNAPLSFADALGLSPGGCGSDPNCEQRAYDQLIQCLVLFQVVAEDIALTPCAFAILAGPEAVVVCLGATVLITEPPILLGDIHCVATYLNQKRACQ